MIDGRIIARFDLLSLAQLLVGASFLINILEHFVLLLQELHLLLHLLISLAERI